MSNSVILKDGTITVSICEPTVCFNRYLDGADWLYIENYNDELPENGSKLYHEWDSTVPGKSLKGILIPMENVVEVCKPV